VSQKSSPFIFVITRSNVYRFGKIAAEKICKHMIYSFLIISSLCTNIRE